MPIQARKLGQLFTSTLTLSACTFGGGFVIIPLMKRQFVDRLGYLPEEEMLNLAAIAQSAPGAVAVNASILLGYRVAGIAGTLAAIAGTILPPMVILSIISLCYDAFRSNLIVAAVLKGMQAGVAAVIADVVLQMGWQVLRSKSVLSIGIMVGAFLATYWLGINVVWIILASGFLGAARAYVRYRRERREQP